MAEITAATVKALREETGQGMMECKKALEETKGDVQAAKDLLKKKGLVTAEKKAGRATSEGLVAILMNDAKTSAAMIEVVCETDFCSRNDVFRAMTQVVAQEAMKASDGPVAASPAIADAVRGALTKIGENMSYARGVKISAPRIATYLHHNGKVGVVVGIEGEATDTVLADLCMHIAFADPVGISTSDIPAELVEREKKIFIEQAIESGKPKDIAEKMVVGKVNKFLAERALLEQPFVRDEKKKVKEILGTAKIVKFARFAVGTATA